MEPITLDLDAGAITRAAIDRPTSPPSGVAFVLAHGAGGDMRARLLEAMARGLSARGHFVLRFDFPYRSSGKKLPDPKAKLVAAYRQVVARLSDLGDFDRVVIGGKSMGGRMATHLAADDTLEGGVVLFGYPLHPPKKPEKLRDEHLPSVRAPMLFLQGTRDPLCDLGLLRPVLAPLERATLHVVQGGDHSLDVLKSSGRSQGDVDEELLEAIERWHRGTAAGVRRSSPAPTGR